jgi:hypothetical protein
VLLPPLPALGVEQIPTFAPCAMVQTTSCAPGSPALVLSPPQQSLFFSQRSPSTRHPCAGWQMRTPVGPKGTQRSLQHGPGQPGVVPAQMTPSTAAQFTEPLGVEQRPGFV